MKIYKNTESAVYPEAVECTANRVFLAKNVRKTVREDTDMFIFDLEEYTKDEYIRKQRADIDYLAMCAGIDMEV